MVEPARIDSSANWSLIFDGPAVADNSIDVADLVGSLHSLNHLVMRANDLTNGRNVTAHLRAKVPSGGSYEIALLLNVLIASNLLPGGFHSTAEVIKRFLFGGQDIPGLFQVFKALRGRRFNVSEASDNSFVLEAKELRVVVPPELFNLVKDRDVWKHARETLDPLRTPGIQKITIRDNGHDLSSFETGDLDLKDEHEVDEQADRFVDLEGMVLRIVAPNLHDLDSKWRLNDGQITRWYAIRDESFVERVKNHELRCGAGDTLSCTVRIRQEVGLSGLNTEYEIIRVTDHFTHSEQPPLF